jgi:hypothetical protein
MPNNLVLCGGTGAHVGVAFLRLHTLGYFLGYFGLNEFPNLYLVDQDAGPASGGDKTAWQEARDLHDRHPGRLVQGHNHQSLHISPLPRGAGNDWMNPPNDIVRQRFDAESLKHILFSERQHNIDMSKGMMASPAAGSLLFKLKTRDIRGIDNHDNDFQTLLTNQSRVAVFGSAVGGTGASVGPTLANLLGERGHEVLAVMLLNWFRLDESELASQEDAQYRNRVMQENQASALTYYEDRLANNIAVLPLGVPDNARVVRRWSGDLQQPMQEHFLHAIAAISAFRHFTPNHRFQPGMYTLGTADAGRFVASTPFQWGTIQRLADRAQALLDLLDLCTRALELGDASAPQARFTAYLQATNREPGQVASQVRDLADLIREQFEWLKRTLHIQTENRTNTVPPLLESVVADFLARQSPAAHENPQLAALNILRWAGSYVQQWDFEESRQGGNPVHQLPTQRANNNFPPAPNLGEFRQVPAGQSLVPGLVDPNHLAVNGWPNPLAYATFFERQLRVGSLRERRMFQFLLVGLINGTFRLRRRSVVPNPSLLSLERFLIEEQERDTGLARLAEQEIIWPGKGRGGSDLVIGSTSPMTLLAPRPFMNDKEDVTRWAEIATTIAGAPREWADPALFGPTKRWDRNNDEALIAVAWLEDMKSLHGQQDAPRWTAAFEQYPSGIAPPFRNGPAVQAQWGADGRALPIPLSEENRLPPIDPITDFREIAQTKDIARRQGASHAEAALRAALQSFDGFDDTTTSKPPCRFNQVKFHTASEEGGIEIEAFWDDHLAQLQRTKLGHNLIVMRHCCDFERKETILLLNWNNDEFHLLLQNTVVLTLDIVKVGSVAKVLEHGRDRYPDLPIKAAYVGLVADQQAGVVHRWWTQPNAGLPQPGRPGTPTIAAGDSAVTWRGVQLLGRSAPCDLAVSVPKDFVYEGQVDIWPNFRSEAGVTTPWSIYYLFEQSGGSTLGAAFSARPIWSRSNGELRVGDDGNVRSASNLFDARTEPIGWGQAGRGFGGVPFAMTLKSANADGRYQNEHGLFWVHLQEFTAATGGTQPSLAVDFGTSHSAAAWGRGNDGRRPIRFADPQRRLGLTVLHGDATRTAKRETQATWFPTESSIRMEYLPTELTSQAEIGAESTSPVSPQISPNPALWAPGRDFRIPSFAVDAKVVESRLLTGFKWQMDGRFHGKEQTLRDIYLRHFMEIALACFIADARQFPSGATTIPVTLLWALRSSEADAERYRVATEAMLRQLGQETGLQLSLNGAGMVDESRAARVERGTPNQFDLVADLGGGTLDTYLAGENPADYVADSVQLGANALLRLLAKDSRNLPPDWGATEEIAFGNLRAWMRAQGARALFSARRYPGEITDSNLNLSNFEDPKQANTARAIYDRYFGLLADFLARTCVCFAEREATLRGGSIATATFNLQLRGNGWRVEYDEDLVTFNREFAARVQRRAAELASAPGLRPEVATLFNRASSFVPGQVPQGPNQINELKVYPVTHALEPKLQALPRDAKKGMMKFNFIDLKQRSPQATAPWFAPLPLSTSAPSNIYVDGALNPPVLLTTEGGRVTQVDTLDDREMQTINGEIQNGSFDQTRQLLDLPMSELIYEPVLKTAAMLPKA